MNISDHIEASMKTAVFKDAVPEHFHAAYIACGMMGEAGEMANAYKKHLRDGKPLADTLSEIGDLIWYACAAADFCNQHDVPYIDIAGWNGPRDTGSIPLTMAELNEGVSLCAESLLSGNLKAVIRRVNFIMTVIDGLCIRLGSSSEEVYKGTLEKLYQRKALGTIHGDGEGDRA